MSNKAQLRHLYYHYCNDICSYSDIKLYIKQQAQQQQQQPPQELLSLLSRRDNNGLLQKLVQRPL